MGVQIGMIKVEGHTFNPDLISSESVIFDIGGNTGGFSREMLDRFYCNVVCYEPDRAAYRHLCSFHYNTFKLVNAAVAAQSGKSWFYSAQPLNGGNSIIPGCREMGRYGQDDVYEVNTVSFEEALAPYNKIDLIKMDCEGAEFEIIMNTDGGVFSKIQQMTIEFHDFCFKQYSIEHVNSCIKKLESYGFKSKYDHADPDKDYYFFKSGAI